MPTVREAAYDLFRSHGMTTMFGNPGSTELPMLADYPSDFRYVLGLQEAVVVGMADGFAQASGKTTVVNLHTAPGVGNAMGAIFNAQANHSPLLITAGQQTRAQITLQANLTNRDATRMPHPLVKWSYEPPRAEDVPLALAHGAHLAGLAPRGPVFVSLPMDDWYAEVDEGDARAAIDRKVSGRASADPEAIRILAAALDAAVNPVLVAGPDIDASGAWDLGIALAERQRLPVWASPATGGNRLGFPEGHPPMNSFLGVPIVLRGAVWGNLYLTEKDDGEFTEADEEAAVVLADYAATAIENARLYQISERRRVEQDRAMRGLEATRDIATAGGGETGLDRVLELIVKRGRALVEARGMAILLCDADDLVITAVAGQIAGELVATRIAGVNHMQQQVRAACLLQRRLKRRDQLVGQLANEADGVGQHDRGAAWQSQPSYSRIERREQLVGDVDIGAGQGAKQG